MTNEPTIPPMEPVAPIVDRMLELAREELQSPRSCRVYLFDDGTIRADVHHSYGDDEREQIRYERTTGEILYEYFDGAHWETETFADGHTMYTPGHESCEVRSLEFVEPPHQ